MIHFIKLVPGIDVGYLPTFFSPEDPRPAREQINQNYAHGGGWHPTSGFKMKPDSWRVKFPGDPVLYPLAYAKLRDETLIFYEHEWLAILQLDGSFEMARVN